VLRRPCSLMERASPAITVPHWSLRLPHGRPGPDRLVLGRPPKVMGILNLTPDSFSDGGLFNDPARAIDRGLALLAQGADLLDLGAESTRPGGGVYGEGARTLPAAEEIARLLPVLRGLRPQTDAPISVDTRKGEVARAALDAGADLINDVAALADPELGRAVAEAGCPLVLMHSRGEISTMQREIHFADLLSEVRGELARAVDRARGLGIDDGQLILDPGIGFGKTAGQNLLLLRRLDAFAELGRPLLVGASRKSFLGRLGPGGEASSLVPPDRRLGGSLAAAGWAALQGASLLRVHDVAETAQFLAAWEAIAQSQEAPAGEIR
ncbi:MAG TPA: dihydropteroate synthase, partial [Thermoanaerobaculia bacterium]|nr:dihydropteroate synthase [Thermoanaerobaculia bacterium]